VEVSLFIFVSFIILFRSGSPMQASVLSVLSAVTDIIHDRSGGNSDAEYFGALVAAMPQNDTDQKLNGSFIVFFWFHI
jgi:hypothetical protein